MENIKTNESAEKAAGTHRKGGLYANVKMSLKTANILVAVLIVALIAVTAFVVTHNGFTVKFDTDGGSQIASVKAMHSEVLTVSEEPVKEGYTFTGWYTDRDCTQRWDMDQDTITGSMTLYAGWEKKS